MANILFVENHNVFAAQVSRAFLGAHEVTVVPSLAQARAELATRRFEVVLIDYDLDDGKGVELIGELHAAADRPFTIGVSSHDLGNTAMLSAGADAICGKMDFRNIESVIQRALSSNSARPADAPKDARG